MNHGQGVEVIRLYIEERRKVDEKMKMNILLP